MICIPQVLQILYTVIVGNISQISTLLFLIDFLYFLSKCEILLNWANFLKKLCDFSKNYHSEHEPKKRLGLFFHETRWYQFIGKNSPESEMFSSSGWYFFLDISHIFQKISLFASFHIVLINLLCYLFLWSVYLKSFRYFIQL